MAYAILSDGEGTLRLDSSGVNAEGQLDIFGEYIGGNTSVRLAGIADEETLIVNFLGNYNFLLGADVFYLDSMNSSSSLGEGDLCKQVKLLLNTYEETEETCVVQGYSSSVTGKCKQVTVGARSVPNTTQQVDDKPPADHDGGGHSIL